MAPFESCRSTDKNLLLASVTKWEDMGCTPGTTPEYLLLLRTHKMQKPSISQGLYPVLLLALLALTTSAYTSLGVSQDSNPQPQLLKASIYHSATSTVLASLKWKMREFLKSVQLLLLAGVARLMLKISEVLQFVGSFGQSCVFQGKKTGEKVGHPMAQGDLTQELDP
jgi:hypothetical protein